jgi:membrane protein
MPSKNSRIKLNKPESVVKAVDTMTIYKEKVIDWMQQLKLPGLKGANLYELVYVFINQLFNTSLTLSASAMAFNFFLAIFPSLIFVFALIPYIPIDNLDIKLDQWMMSALPQTAVLLLHSIMEELFKDRGIAVLSISFVVVIYSATRGLNTMIEAFRAMDPNFTPRLPFIKQYLRAFVLFIVLFLFIIIALGVNIFVELLLSNVFNFFEPIKGFNRIALHLLEIGTEAVFILLGISILYTSVKDSNIHINFVSAGSIAASILMFFAFSMLKILFSTFLNYNKIYGSLATAIVLMIWFYWISIILLFGYNFNVSIRNVILYKARSIQSN